MKISPARVAAFDILIKIDSEQAYSSELLPLYESDLSERDRSLCHQLTLGVLRRQIYLDHIINQFVDGKRIDPAVRIVLRLGLFQILFLDKIPDHSAVNDSVNLVQRAKKTSAKGLVNAVLRRSAREPVEFRFQDDVERVSVQTSHPRWLIEKWISRFGADDAEQLAAANNEVPKTAFRLTANASAVMAFDGATPSEYVDGCFIVERNTDELRHAAAAGEIYFQDEGSQVVAAATDLKGGESLLDVCAAPGSKLTQIAAGSGESHGFIAGGDLHSHRVRFLAENCINQGTSGVSVLQYDAEKGLPFAEGAFDVVLVDAPCSGTGTIRHNPEIRYSLDPSDLPALQAKQLQIVRNASKLVRVGGRLLYSTCSLESEENEQVANCFLTDAPEFEKGAVNVPDRFMSEDGYARTFPSRDDTDGFFIASFVRA